MTDVAAASAAPSSTEAAGSRRRLYVALGLALAVALFGMLARLQMMAWGLVHPGPLNVYFRLYAFHEPVPLALLIVWTLAAAIACAWRTPPASSATWLERLPTPGPKAVGGLAAALFVVSLATWYLVHHAVLLTMDEFTTDFQARILAHGQVRAMLPTEWQPYVDALAPVFTAYQDLQGGWLSQYLPGYAMLKAPFVLTGLGVLLNPLLAAASVVLLAAIARRIWPDEGLRPWLALAFFVTSSEVLMTSGTGYSMPAHLTLNLLWLWLYLRGDTRSWGIALVVGVLAMGLHNPIPHVLFVAPFMLRVVRERRWRRAAAAIAVYGAGTLLWMAWLRMANPFAHSGGPGLFSMFEVPNRIAFWLQSVNLSLLFTWHAPLFGALAAIGVWRARRLGVVMSDIALGAAVTLVFYLFFPLTQGHGWGHRYAYQVLGNLALLAAAGAPSLVAAVGARRAQWLLAASFATALLVQIPLRFVQGERFIRPWAAAHRYVASRPADVVIVHGDSIWYGRDLLRNDPYLREGPIVLAARFLPPESKAAIERAHAGRVIEVRDAELFRFGLIRWVRRRER